MEKSARQLALPHLPLHFQLHERHCQLLLETLANVFLIGIFRVAFNNLLGLLVERVGVVQAQVPQSSAAFPDLAKRKTE